MPDFYDQLSKAYALRGGDLPLTQEYGKDVSKWSGTPMVFEQITRLLFTGFELPAFARELAKCKDGLPLPEVFNWRPGRPKKEALAELQPEEWRAYLAFQQIVERGCKSGKYLAAMHDLQTRYPHLQEIPLLIFKYLCIWEPEALFSFVETQLAAHPDWRILRYVYAGHLLLRQTPVDAQTQAAFLTQMNQQLELHLHLRGQEPDAWEVLAFYQAQATWFVFGELHLERALYAINVCQQVLNELYGYNYTAYPPETRAILKAWFCCFNESSEVMTQIQAFLKPLLQGQLKAVESRLQALEKQA